MKAELKAAVLASGSHLMDIHGIGPAGAARILADVADVARFPNRAHFASWTGTAPIDASSGQHTHHRLSRAGNRRLNHVLYTAGLVQLRHDTPGRAYYRRRIAEGKTPMEAMRCLRRRLSDVVYRQLAADAQALGQTGPGGHSGATLLSSAADLPPDIGTSDQPLPGPAPTTLPPPPAAQATPAARTGAPPRRRARGVNMERPAGTNDVDTDQRRHTLDIAWAALLTTPLHRREPDEDVAHVDHHQSMDSIGGGVVHGSPDTDQPVPSSGSGHQELTAQELFKQMMRDPVAPPLRELGMQGSVRRGFRYQRGDYTGFLGVEKHRYSTRHEAEFTVNVGATYTPTQQSYWYDRLGFLMPARHDTWWTLRVGQPIEPVADEVLAAIRDYGWPAILAALESPDSPPSTRRW
jgi:hypothetical protein